MKASPKINPAKLFIGFIFSREEIYLKTKSILEKKFGQSDFESQILPFNHTHYYKNEFGADLKRKFISFRRLCKPEKLPYIKIITNKIEIKFSRQDRRQINIDPGILNLSKVILVTTKDYRHRIYLDKGIYAEVTLYYQNKSFQSWEWTYPDYKTQAYMQIFNTIRGIYVQQINAFIKKSI